MDEDLWGTESGLFSDYQGKVVDCWFGNDSKVGNGQVLILFLKMQTDVPEHPEWTERYTCGPDWQTIDGGKTAVHPTKKKFNSNAQAGIFVDKALAVGAGPDLKSRGLPPTDAAAWLGTSWYMEAVERTGKLQDGTDFKSVRNYPSKFLGIDGNMVMAGTPRPQDSVAESSGGTTGVLAGLDEVAVAQMTGWAKTLTHTEWLDRVMELEGVTANEELVIALTDEQGLYSKMKGE